MALDLQILAYEYVADVLERRGPYREAHLRLVDSWIADGRLLMAGPIGDPPSGAQFVFSVADPGEIEAFVEADPYVESGIVSARTVAPWTVVAHGIIETDE